MSLTLSTYPPLVAPAKNPVIFGYTSDNYIVTPASAASIRLTFAAGLVDGESFKLTFGGQTYTFLVKTSPDNSGLQIKAYNAEGINSWVIQTANQLQKNYALSTHYYIAYFANTINIVARENGSNYSITLSNPPANLSATDVVAGVDEVTQANFAVISQIWMNRSTQMVKIFEDSLSINSTGATLQDISELLKSELYSEFEFPEVAANSFVKRNHINVSFYVRYAEQYGTPATIKAIETSQYFTALYGGVPFWKQVEYYNAGTSFWDRMKYDMNFLTWQPKTKKISPSQSEKLYWLAWKNTLNNTQVRLRISCYYYDNGTLKCAVAYSGTQAVTYLDVYEIEVGYKRLCQLYNLEGYFLHDNEDGVPGQYYTVEVVTNTTPAQVLSETRTYQIDIAEYPYKREFLFLNSLGGYDVVRTTGIGESEAKQERTFVSSPYPKEFSNAFRMKKQVFVTGNETMKVNSGWLTSDQANWFQDFLLSDDVFEIKNDILYPVVITSQSGPKKTDEQSPAYFVEFEYEYCAHDTTYAKSIEPLTGGDFNEDYNPDFLTQ